MAQLFVISTAYGAIAAATAMREGLIAEGRGERILIAVNGAPVPELSPIFASSPHLGGILAHFDRTESLNDLIAPVLPIAWEPSEQDQPMLERLLRIAWSLGSEPVDLFLQSPQVAPATSLAAIFPGSPICVLGDGLMTYGPLRSKMPWVTASRVSEVHYVDVVPGVVPVLFSDVGAKPTAIGSAALRSILDETADAAHDESLDELAASGGRTVLVLGQYLAALDIVTAHEEDEMQREMVRASREFGAERIVFKPHPSAPPGAVDGPRREAASLGMSFSVYAGSLPAEVVAMKLGVVAAVGGFSTALPTIAATLKLPVRAVGNEVLLARLTPYENSNRVPVTLIDAMTRVRSPYRDAERMQRLLDAVAYCMQPRQMSHLRARALAFVQATPQSEIDRYLDGRILTNLGLPGGAPQRLGVRVLNATTGEKRARDIRDTYRAGARRLRYAWRALGRV
ncbi:polysialyltransferase family glycosyltransferase (plasmid) [Coraliomargarita sp. W4R53]